MRIKDLKIREIFASNSKKTIEVELETEKGKVISSVPIGTSRGRHEVVYLPVEEATRKFLMIRRNFITKDFENQKDVDSFLRIIDETPNFSDIGGNLALAVSSVFLKAFALEQGKDIFEFLLKEKPFMPKPICNVVGRKGKRDIEEFLLLPVHQESFLSSINKMTRAYEAIGKMFEQEDTNFTYSKDLESAWATTLPLEKILTILKKVAAENLLKPGVDVAASQIWDGKYYTYASTGSRLGSVEQLSFIEELATKFGLFYVEDPFREDDFVSFATLTHRLQPRIVSGDDLYASNLKRFKDGLDFKSTNAIIVKPNQVGTITDIIKLVEEAKKRKITTIMSHRSGETEDTLVCHLAVGLNCDYVKFGISGERLTKINEMLRIEERLKG